MRGCLFVCGGDRSPLKDCIYYSLPQHQVAMDSEERGHSYARLSFLSSLCQMRITLGLFVRALFSGMFWTGMVMICHFLVCHVKAILEASLPPPSTQVFIKQRTPVA